jgi:plasmid stabilization system protein ParE
MEVIIQPLARKDINHGYDWYEKRQPGLGNKFLKEVIAHLQKIKRENIEYRKYTGDIQYIKLERFPFSIFFIKDRNLQIAVIAVLFNRQDILKILSKRK